MENKKILIVDDEIELLDSLQDLFMAKAHKIKPNITFIFMSGGFAYSEATLKKLGAKAFLQKLILDFKNTILKV